jgi:hypothetical protein
LQAGGNIVFSFGTTSRILYFASYHLEYELTVESLVVLLAQHLAIEVEYTREKLLAELENARSVAEKAKNGSAMAMATLGKAKILGLIIDRREVGEVGAFDSMTDEQLVEEAKKRSAALGLSSPDLPETQH